MRRRNLSSLHNMKPNIDQSSQKDTKMDFNQYRQKLDDLLQRVTIQNKYANRVSHSNIRNIQQLQVVKHELHQLISQRKTGQSDQTYYKKLSNQLSQSLLQCQSHLTITINQVFTLKLLTKSLRKQIQILTKQLQTIKQKNKSLTRQKYTTRIQIYDKQNDKLISTLIENYIKQIEQPNSIILYKHCLQTLKNKQFNCFLKKLEIKINQIQIENREHLRLPNRERMQSLINRNDNSFRQKVFTPYAVKKYTTKNPIKLPSFRIRTDQSIQTSKFNDF